tara:strand:- start:1172 stop:1477 length:306 start_codon:yes stop_codon:yes gene_type:complete
MATRQNSTNGKPKSPRIQVVLPELLFEKLAKLAEEESRTVSNMAKVLIQKGIESHLKNFNKSVLDNSEMDTDTFRNNLEKRSVKKLKGMPKRIRYVDDSKN